MRFRALLPCLLVAGTAADAISSGPGVSDPYVATDSIQLPGEEREAACQPWCVEPCSVLTGNVEDECGGCATDAHWGCHARAADFDNWYERQQLREGKISITDDEVNALPSVTLPKLESADAELDGGLASTFDASHGCREREIGAHSCGVVNVQTAEEVAPTAPTGRAFCAHARCQFKSLGSGGVDVRAVAKSPGAYLGHPFFPARFAAAEIGFSLCLQLAQTHTLEGPECLCA